ncbi:hypothetical protein ABZ078_21700 [Streptomyces sp. NPDC006385]|uniref:hypothetical protein n=1 Tax=Streptomyces sp. NPDC006385 TaxID=3156761 RepID=UPI0033BDC046
MAKNGNGETGGAGAFGRRLLLSVDAKGYGSADTATQQQFQETIVRLLHESADAAELKRRKWKTQEGGDSLFAVLPKHAYEPALVDDFMRGLEAGLRDFNSSRVPKERLRLRAAVHFGEASRASNGYVGTAPVEIGRIRDCAAMRAALDQMPDACLAVGLSATVFRDVVQGKPYTSLRENEFQEVLVKEKEYRGAVWIWLPGEDVRQLKLPTEVPDGEGRGTALVRSELKLGTLEGNADATGLLAEGALDGPVEAATEVDHVAGNATVIGVHLRSAGGKQ